GFVRKLAGQGEAARILGRLYLDGRAFDQRRTPDIGGDARRSADGEGIGDVETNADVRDLDVVAPHAPLAAGHADTDAGRIERQPLCARGHREREVQERELLERLHRPGELVRER